MEIELYGYQVSGCLPGQGVSPYDYDYKFSLVPKRWLTVDELNNFFLNKTSNSITEFV